MGKEHVECAYCGGSMPAYDANCASCGSRAVKMAEVLIGPVAGPKPKSLILGLFVWLTLGLFGGYAYWSGNRIKAYARIVLWLTCVGWMTLGIMARNSGNEALSSFYGFPFLATLLLIFLLWLLDLAHLLRTAGARD